MAVSTLLRRSLLLVIMLLFTPPRDDHVFGRRPVVEGIFRLGLRVDGLREVPTFPVDLSKLWTVFTMTPKALCHSRGRVRPCWKW